jgi:YesN/AraC family two-component response regulator
MQHYEVLILLSQPSLRTRLSELLAAYSPPLDVVFCCETVNELEDSLTYAWPPPLRVLFTEYRIFRDARARFDEMFGPTYRCILVDAPRNFADLLDAVHMGVCDWLCTPLDPQQTQDCVTRFLAYAEHAFLPQKNEASRYLFWREDLRRLLTTPLTMQDVNNTYGTYFADGLFQGIFIELKPTEEKGYPVSKSSLQDIALHLSHRYLQSSCFDILFNRHAAGISLLINYAVADRERIAQSISALFFALRSKFLDEYRVVVTLSTSRSYREFSKLPEIKQEMLDTRWYRKSLGAGRMISADMIAVKSVLTPEQQHNFNALRDLVMHYYETLNIEQAIYYINATFDQFQDLLSVRQLRIFSRELSLHLFKLYSNELQQAHENSEALQQEYIYRESMTSDMEHLRQTVIENVSDLMGRITKILHQQYSPPISDCIQYISTHSQSDLSLQTLAALVGLSPQYLSTLFHDETGMTITQYIARQKVRLAQNLLTNSRDTINQIANALGFEDSHYFSKFFKKYSGQTPSEYRRTTQAKAALQQSDSA